MEKRYTPRKLAEFARSNFDDGCVLRGLAVGANIRMIGLGMELGLILRNGLISHSSWEDTATMERRIVIGNASKTKSVALNHDLDNNNHCLSGGRRNTRLRLKQLHPFGPKQQSPESHLSSRKPSFSSRKQRFISTTSDERFESSQ